MNWQVWSYHSSISKWFVTLDDNKKETDEISESVSEVEFVETTTVNKLVKTTTDKTPVVKTTVAKTPTIDSTSTEKINKIPVIKVLFPKLWP